MLNDIFGTIQSYEESFLTKPIEIVPGYRFDQRSTIQKIHRYFYSVFEKIDPNAQGHRFFFNILKPRARNATKNIDLDTKDILIKPTRGEFRTQAMILRRDVQLWLRKRRIAKTLNEIASDAPIFGTVVAKKVPNERVFDLVDIRNLVNDPTTKNLADSWVIENHWYTPTELRKFKKVWDEGAIDEAIKSFTTTRKENFVDNYADMSVEDMGTAEYILVKEFYGEVPKYYLGDNRDDDTATLAQFVVVMSESGGAGLVLHHAEIEQIPYKELHYERAKGRWMGVGVFEEGFEPQMLKNEQINLLAEAFRLSQLILFQTGDETIARNILTDLLNGDILKVQDQISRIDTRVLDSNASVLISREVEKMADALANSFEVTTGESLPSGTPFSLGALMNQNANKLFDFIREDFGIFVQEIMEDWVLPELEKDLNTKHTLELIDRDEVEFVRRNVMKTKLWTAVKDAVFRLGRMPTMAEIQAVEQIFDQRMASESVFLEIPKGYYNFEKQIEVVVTNEAHNKAERMATLASIIQMVSGNPQIIESPAFQQILDFAGLNQTDVLTPQTPQQPAPSALGSAARNLTQTAVATGQQTPQVPMTAAA